jgi:hypothetical protein
MKHAYYIEGIEYLNNHNKKKLKINIAAFGPLSAIVKRIYLYLEMI